MNKWFRRAVGTVGVAGGILLLGAGAAHADDSLMPGQLDDLFSPAGGPNNQSLQLESHGSTLTTTAADGQHAMKTRMDNQRQQIPNVLRDLPLNTILPTDSLGMPQATSSRVRTLPATEGSLPVVGSLDQLGLPGVGMTGDTLRGTSIADQRAAFPSFPGMESASRTEAGGGLPLVGGGGLPVGGGGLPVGGAGGGGLPLVGEAGGLPVVGSLPLLSGGGLPVRGTLKPVDDVAVPVGAGQRGQRNPRVHTMRAGTESAGLPLVDSLPLGGGAEAGGLPVVGDLPLGGSDVLKNDSVTGVPVIGGVGPTPGVSTTGVTKRFVPTTGALPQATSQLPLVAEKTYAPRHASSYTPRHAGGASGGSEEALPVLGGLPVVGGLLGGGVPGVLG